MTSKLSDASALAYLLDGSTTGELVSERVRHGLQPLIQLVVATVLSVSSVTRLWPDPFSLAPDTARSAISPKRRSWPFAIENPEGSGSR